jgi:Ca2+-binding RTX toxin-like protein
MNVARFTGAANKNNVDTQAFNDYLSPVYAASIALVVKPHANNTLVTLALTGALTLTVNVGSATAPPMIGDTLQILATSDGTTRTITFSTGFNPTLATFAVTTAKFGNIAFVFNGTTWVETGRTISA